MSGDDQGRRAAVNDELHPHIYGAIAALSLWLVLSVWVFFNRGGYIGLALGMVTLFFVIATGVPALIWRIWRRHAADAERRRTAEPFRAWARRDFATWSGRLGGRAAAIQILLPIVAVSLGMTIFGLVFALTVPRT
ncbi:MAG: hypothetical protein IRY89_15330 [Pseudolabrys sp.]|nr:hypothetical protein [Pseudolabrys sp.]